MLKYPDSTQLPSLQCTRRHPTPQTCKVANITMTLVRRELVRIRLTIILDLLNASTVGDVEGRTAQLNWMARLALLERGSAACPASSDIFSLRI